MDEKIICSYCQTPIDNVKSELVICNSCGTPYHNECWEENHSCSTYGCNCEECHTIFDVSFPRQEKTTFFSYKPTYNPHVPEQEPDYTRVSCNHKNELYDLVTDEVLLKYISQVYHIELNDQVEYRDFSNEGSEGIVDKIYYNKNNKTVRIDIKDRDTETICEKADPRIITNNITFKRERSVNTICLIIGIIMALSILFPTLTLLFK